MKSKQAGNAPFTPLGFEIRWDTLGCNKLDPCALCLRQTVMDRTIERGKLPFVAPRNQEQIGVSDLLMSRHNSPCISSGLHWSVFPKSMIRLCRETIQH